MTLTLYFHPLSSYCHKVLIALYENAVPFTPLMVNFGDPASRDAFLKVWAVGKFPVIRDEKRDWTVPESSIIIEYLDQHFPGPVKLIPADADLARQCRMRDRFYDMHLHNYVQAIVGDRIRPAGKKDPFGVEQARTKMRTALDIIDKDMADKTWAMGDTFTMADCAAAPALFYADKITPYAATHKNAAAYLARLMARPSYARALKEAEPYFQYFPKE